MDKTLLIVGIVLDFLCLGMLVTLLVCKIKNKKNSRGEK